MFDGVSNGALDGSFAAQVDAPADAEVPIYQIAAPAQAGTPSARPPTRCWPRRRASTRAHVRRRGARRRLARRLDARRQPDLRLRPAVGDRARAGRQHRRRLHAEHRLDQRHVRRRHAGDRRSTASTRRANQQIIMGPTAAIGTAHRRSPTSSRSATRSSTSLIDAVGGIFGFSILPDPGQHAATTGCHPDAAAVRCRQRRHRRPDRLGRARHPVRARTATPPRPTGTSRPRPTAPSTANGVIWLQHGFLGFNELVRRRWPSSWPRRPTASWWCPTSSGSTPRSARAATWAARRCARPRPRCSTGDRDGADHQRQRRRTRRPLPEKFLLTGHSAGGNFATAVGALIAEDPTTRRRPARRGDVRRRLARPAVHRLARRRSTRTRIPDYQIAGTPQSWNAWGVATELMYKFYGPDQFYGVQIDNGSHTDVIAGASLFAQAGRDRQRHHRQPVAAGRPRRRCAPSPPAGSTTSTPATPRTVTTRTPVIRHLRAQRPETPTAPDVANQPIVMGEAGAATLPSPPPV